MKKDLKYRAIKRAMDLTLGLFLLIFSSPIMLVTILVIKLDSRGSIFPEVPKRVGRGGRLFNLLKFRSMINNAHSLLRTDPKFKRLLEEYKKDSYKLRDDPRITRIGKFIRKYSIDEMPQFINVIKGDMSIVGPRPYYPDELKDQQKKFPDTRKYAKKMLEVKPGITGSWQVSGRSDVNFDERIAMDAQYADKKSIWLDVKILLKTPWAMLSGRGAR